MRKFLVVPMLLAPLALATPIAAQAQNMPQILQGMMTGNQGQDQKIRDAYERGYQKGRQDEAQMARGRPNSRDDRGQPPYSRPDDYRR